jgi:glucose-1-phosphate cytidylyltransferase
MELYAQQGFDEFVVALGYMGNVIEEYFRRESNWQTGKLANWQPEASEAASPPVRQSASLQIHLCDTGHDSMTGGRLLRLAPLLRDEGTFMVTYGDGLADVNIEALLAFHRAHGRLVTVTAVHPPLRLRFLDIDGDDVRGFAVPERSSWVNGGFFVFEPGIFDYLTGDSCVLESEALVKVARDGELMAFRHDGFWQCMDTPQERDYLEGLWRCGAAPWTISNKQQATSNGVGV